MPGLFVTFEGNEGSGKSTQIRLLADRVRAAGREVITLREPGSTPVGEEIRHTLKHSPHNHAMTPEAELLLMNASRAQLVREVVRPALEAGQVVLCDRFFDSTTVYQGAGRGLDPAAVQAIIDFAVGPTRPDLTLLLSIPLALSEERRASRLAATGAQETIPQATAAEPVRDRIEEAGRMFFARVDAGYRALALSEPARVRVVDGTGAVASVAAAVWGHVEPLLARTTR